MNIEVAKKRIDEVIRTDVITSSESDFLVTHVPLRKIEVIKGGHDPKQKPKYATEEMLFKDYLLNPENKHQLIVVKGPSGSGKSHLIRWFSARLQKSPLENEVVLFIRRSENNLKGTIKQLLALDEVVNTANKEIIERLVKATSIMDDNKFRDWIYQNFIVELKNDDETEILSNADKKNLIALLQNDLFQKRLKMTNGPIDRIYAKVTSDQNPVQQDVVALFNENDFIIDIDFCEDLKDQGCDRKAEKIARKLIGIDEIPLKIASQLNQYVDSVIQACTGIEPGDFEQIFFEIRQALNKNGKNLTLLIEDITACTGINKALLNALITEHTGMHKSSNLCRISSIIGTTEAYFNDTFRDNYRDRITTQFYIHENILGNNENDIIEFVAKYLNAMSLERDQIENWLLNGCDEEQFPLHDEKQGKKWEKFTIFNKEINLYPLTRNAIMNLYNNLGTDRKTPRYLLQDVIERTVRDILWNTPNFPGFHINEMPNWNPVNHGQILAQDITTDTDLLERLGKFIRVWGNRSLYRYKTDDVDILGGIPTHIYEELGFPVVTGIKQLEKPEDNAYSPENHSNEVIPGANLIQKSEPTPLKGEVSKEEKDYQEKIREVDKWITGQEFVSFNQVRDDICSFLNSAINWQLEGVSYDNIIRINKSKKRHYIGFERQRRALDDSIYILPANQKTKTIVEAFIGWRVLGKCSWGFNGGYYALYQITKWFNDIKDDIIKAINTVDGLPHMYFECGCAAEIYRLILFGEFTGNKLTSLKPELLIKPEIGQLRENGHSKEWNALMKLMLSNDQAVENKELVQNYYNLFQGEIKKAYSKNLFLDDLYFRETFKKVISNKLQINKTYLDSTDPVGQRNKPKEYYFKIVDRIKAVSEAEKALAENCLNKVSKYFGTDTVDEEDICDLCTEIHRYYIKMAENQINFEPKDDKIKKYKNNSKTIALAIECLKETQTISETLDLLMLFSNDPITPVKDLVHFLEEIEADVMKTEVTVANKIGKISNTVIQQRDTDNEKRIDDILRKFSQFANDLEAIYAQR